jgi:prepilin-type N-terminal cleavage/methylation domain-containing protein
MNKLQHNSPKGFSMVELLVASSIGLVVVLTMTSLFKIGMDATFTVTQRAEVQQNMRAAIEMMTQDLTHAGAGLPTGGLQLATNGVSKYACDQTGACYITNHSYPNNVGTGTPNYMYGILPGYGNGVQGGLTIPNASGARDDSITSVYADYNFPLSNFDFFAVNGTTVCAALTGGPPATPAPTAGLPTNILAPGGLNVGDVLLFYVQSQGNGTTASGTSWTQTAAVGAEITSIATGGADPSGKCVGTTWTLGFAAGDPLNMNQTAGANNLTSAFAAPGTMTVSRLNVVTYYLQVPAAGGTVQTPRLMRQVNGLSPVPVADNIINLQFSYDVIDAFTGYLSANLNNPIASGESPSLIQKVNIWVMGESLTSGGKKSQSMYLITSVAARNMSFCNSYSASSTACANE